MELTYCCIQLEVHDVNGREITLWCERIDDLDHLLCIVANFVEKCKEQNVTAGRLCNIRPRKFEVNV